MKNMTKIMMAATLALGTLAAGCQTTTTPKSSVEAPAPVAQPVTKQQLQAYNWQLVDAKRSNGDKVTQLFVDPAKPLTLNFFKDNGTDRVSFMNTCNNIGGEYSVVDGSVQLSNVFSTMKACPEPEASFDTATMATVQGKYSLGENANNVPILTIKNDNQVAYFKGVAK
ncbi:META domain-containing protein [uncultured Psychrobacter sp.]|uniref:META domain-containing protein n=1 Tax=uncultured Psychrobacter sp. TaxID=259303 RepID=UPI003459646A